MYFVLALALIPLASTDDLASEAKTCEITEIVKFFKTYGIQDGHGKENTVDDLWLEVITHPALLPLKEITSELMRLNRLFLIEVTAIYLSPQNCDSTQILQNYFSKLVELYQVKVESFFCRYRQCQNGAVCLLRPKDGILTYETVLKLPDELRRYLQILKSDATLMTSFGQYIEFVPLAAFVGPDLSTSAIKDPDEALYEILAPADIEVLRELGLIEGYYGSWRYYYEADVYDHCDASYHARLVFDEENLAFLGMVFKSLSEIIHGQKPIPDVAQNFVQCQCASPFIGQFCQFLDGSQPKQCTVEFS